MNPQAKKKSKRSFGKGGKKPTINNPDTHHGTYDLPNASVRSYSEKAKPMKFAKGGEISQEDIDKMSYGEAFRHFRAKGAGTKFTYKGSKQAAYRKGEEPESFKRNAAAPKTEAAKPKTEAAKPAPKSESKAAPPRPTTQAETNRNQAEAALASARMIKPKDMDAAKQFSTLAGQGGPMAEYYRQQAKKFSGETFAKGGTVNKYSKMNMGGMAGYKSGGSCGSGMKKYADGGAIKKPYVPTAADRNEKAGGDQEMENRSQTRGAGRGPMSRNGMKPKAYARGGGVESHGKTKGSMVKMASGGSVSARADGVASKGKTNCKIC